LVCKAGIIAEKVKIYSNLERWKRKIYWY
jgi:hypothetical protein